MNAFQKNSLKVDVRCIDFFSRMLFKIASLNILIYNLYFFLKRYGFIEEIR